VLAKRFTKRILVFI